MSEKDDIETLLDGVLSLARGSEATLRDLQGILISIEAGTLSPVEQHKFKGELRSLIDGFTEVREGLEGGSTPRPLPQTFTPPDRHNESLANATVRDDMLAGVEAMRQSIASCKSGLSKAVTVVGSWVQSGRTPSRAELKQTRDGLEKGVLAMDGLQGAIQGFEQRLRWFDPQRNDQIGGGKK